MSLKIQKLTTKIDSEIHTNKIKPTVKITTDEFNSFIKETIFTLSKILKYGTLEQKKPILNYIKNEKVL